MILNRMMQQQVIKIVISSKLSDRKIQNVFEGVMFRNDSDEIVQGRYFEIFESQPSIDIK